MVRRRHFVLKEMGSHGGLSRQAPWSELIMASHLEHGHSMLLQLRVQLCSNQLSSPVRPHIRKTLYMAPLGMGTG